MVANRNSRGWKTREVAGTDRQSDLSGMQISDGGFPLGWAASVDRACTKFLRDRDLLKGFIKHQPKITQ
jgi:hypothetical protein